MNEVAYIINGVFFQNQQWLGVNMKPIEGAVAVIHSGLCRFMFCGAIQLNAEPMLGGHLGTMFDKFGDADLTNIELTETKFRFVKKYTKRDDTINYEFELQPDGTWAGGYNGEATGAGKARCTLTTVSASFFEAP